MSTRKKRTPKRARSIRQKRTSDANSLLPSSPRPPAPKLTSPQAALDECVAAISLIEVTTHSLDSQEIASPEQEVLKRALKSIWSVHDWIYELRLGDSDASHSEEDAS